MATFFMLIIIASFRINFYSGKQAHVDASGKAGVAKPFGPNKPNVVKLKYLALTILACAYCATFWIAGFGVCAHIT
jgi:hypothetical protein